MEFASIEISTQAWILLDVCIAVLFGGALGFEREHEAKPAGFRTNMFVAGAAALLISIGKIFMFQSEGEFAHQALSMDPTRLIQAIIVGVSFIGAGTILKSKGEHTVRYLTTAATLLFSASIGIAVALKLYTLAGGVTVLGLLINYLIKRVELKFFSKQQRYGKGSDEGE